MEIKKADSKGRVSGFEPGSQYGITRTKGDDMTLTPLERRNKGGISDYLPSPPEGMKWITDVFLRRDLTVETLQVRVSLEADYGSPNLPMVPVYGYHYSLETPPEIDEVVKAANFIRESYLEREREIIEERKQEANLKDENSFFVMR